MSEDLRAYLVRRLTEALGPPGRTGSGNAVWAAHLVDEPVLVTIEERGRGGYALRVLQAPDTAAVEVCADKYFEVADRPGADRAVAPLTKDAPA